MCAGARVAELEILSFMSRLIQDFKVDVAPGSPIPELATYLTIKPDPKPTYTFTKRKN
jgi:hypothetical protein